MLCMHESHPRDLLLFVTAALFGFSDFSFVSVRVTQGPIPTELGNLKTLTDLYLDGNNLSG